MTDGISELPPASPNGNGSHPEASLPPKETDIDTTWSRRMDAMEESELKYYAKFGEKTKAGDSRIMVPIVPIYGGATEVFGALTSDGPVAFSIKGDYDSGLGQSALRKIIDKRIEMMRNATLENPLPAAGYYKDGEIIG